MDELAFARALQVFRSLSDEELERLMAAADRRAFAPGTTIVRRGEPGDSMYVIQQGSVQVPIFDDEGRQRFCAYLGPGDFFGEMALITGEARGADVIADGDVEVRCLVLDRVVVEELLRHKPRVARFLTEIVGKRLLESGQMRYVGKHRVLREIGRGGIAIVYEGLHPSLGRSVAIKMLSHELVYEQDFAERFLAEARIIADLRHDNIVQVYDAEQAYATLFIVMERLDGVELKTLATEGGVSFDEARHILRQVCRGLKYAHERGVVHRDIKPSNLFVETSGRVKIMDFGIAGGPISADDARSHGIMGTPGYIAPELLLGQGADHRADIYALGVVAYEVLVGRSPFEAKQRRDVLRNQLATDFVDLAAARPDAPADLVEFVRRATERDRDARFRSCAEILSHFDPPARRYPGDDDVITLTVRCDPRDRRQVDALLDELRARLAVVDSAKITVG